MFFQLSALHHVPHQIGTLQLFPLFFDKILYDRLQRSQGHGHIKDQGQFNLAMCHVCKMQCI